MKELIATAFILYLLYEYYCLMVAQEEYKRKTRYPSANNNRPSKPKFLKIK